MRMESRHSWSELPSVAEISMPSAMIPMRSRAMKSREASLATNESTSFSAPQCVVKGVEMAANPVPEGLAVPSISRRQEVHYSNGRSLARALIHRVSFRRIGRCDRGAKAGAFDRFGGGDRGALATRVPTAARFDQSTHADNPA